jgi:hypothetical protein
MEFEVESGHETAHFVRDRVQPPAGRAISALPPSLDPWFTGCMRRLLLIALTIALLVGATAGVASARFANSGGGIGPKAAPFHAPAVPPAADRTQPDAFTYRSAASIGAQLQRDAAPAAGASSAGAGGATVTVTAVVLPVVIIVLDAETGDVAELMTNTPERDARGIVYLVRTGTDAGAPAELTPATWAQARAALAHATAGTGTIWSA